MNNFIYYFLISHDGFIQNILNNHVRILLNLSFHAVSTVNGIYCSIAVHIVDFNPYLIAMVFTINKLISPRVG